VLTAAGARAAMREEGGFSLIELMIAMVTGLIVTGVLFSVLIFSVNETTRLSDVAQANQLGRTTMTHIVDELHSACVTSRFAPIQETSTEGKLVFVTGYSEEAEIPSVATVKGGVRKEEIEWNAKEEKLWDSSYPGTGESKGEYTFSATPTKVLIGENITQSVEPSGEKKAIPIFKYFAYATKASKGSGEVSSALEESKSLATGGTAIGKTEAAKAASVLISFRTAPIDKKNALGGNASAGADRSVDLSSQATLAFSAPNAEATLKAGPCE
jgi:type II secretory pathway pseudopilin PulG